MTIVYEHIDSTRRYYKGISIDKVDCQKHLAGKVKDNLLDREEWHYSIESLKALLNETGFNANEELLLNIQSLEEERVEAQTFRVGEAYAEVVLEQEFSCRFHWNEKRDTRNPKGNKTGADLVGFIDIDGQVLFLFGEVKTSSEVTTRPPQVMTNADGIEKQLRDLYNETSKRLILISYLQNKMRHFPEEHQFRTDFESSCRAYYSGQCEYQLIGVLVRDIAAEHRDVSVSYNRLREHVLEPKGIKLLALYLPIVKEEWLGIINENEG